ncbi:MAG: cell division protein FtsQ [Tannerellaceae bacterium]|jgi:cell division protein FtsQ|nr:cell division protein FtsQ [Tannerellaceae bacterium]
MKAIRILSVLTAAILLGYLVLTALFFQKSRRGGLCTELIVEVRDSRKARFISEAGMVATLKQTGLYPVGRMMDGINTEQMEKELIRNDMIDRVNIYKTPSGIVRIDAWQKTPLMRVMSADGDFYIDSRGSLMSVSRHYAVHVPVAGGYVGKEFAKTELYEFALFLQENEFWNNQIEQIYVHPDRDVELVPRVGEHRILLGPMDNFREKLENLRLFYRQAMPKLGWGKYRIINLKFKNQIVCTKK